ncbi:MAG: hypothetical protein M0R50_05015 [Candidatus Cloacimonetes bacterium]|nr:hypothetical protein [Candidatus Cloacimonadota bacterium]
MNACNKSKAEPEISLPDISVLAHPLFDAEQHYMGSISHALDMSVLPQMVLSRNELGPEYDLWAMDSDGVIVSDLDSLLQQIFENQISFLTKIQAMHFMFLAYRPYIECPPNRGDTARCSPRFLFITRNNVISGFIAYSSPENQADMKQISSRYKAVVTR